LNPPDLVADAVVKRFADHVAVDSLSFSVERGSFFSILGPSGCGKTTLLRMIAGFIAPDGGDIAIGGKSMRGVAPNRRPVNMVFQQREPGRESEAQQCHAGTDGIGQCRGQARR
jgi:spermidine/putrescine transport system ATP-binding protein